MNKFWEKLFFLTFCIIAFMSMAWDQSSQVNASSFAFWRKSSTQELTADQIYDRCSQSIVRIFPLDNRGQVLSVGSGFILSDGRIVTNAHVIENARRIQILDASGKELSQVRLITVDKQNDLAIIVANVGRRSGLELLEDSSWSSLRVGQRVYVLGAPRGLSNTLSDGLISALRGTTSNNFGLLQITAPVSPGSSGGPVLNGEGKVIGVVTLQLTDSQNLNFAIPSTLVRRLSSSPDLQSHGVDELVASWRRKVEWIQYAGHQALEMGNAGRMAEVAHLLVKENAYLDLAKKLAREARLQLDNTNDHTVQIIYDALILTDQKEMAESMVASINTPHIRRHHSDRLSGKKSDAENQNLRILHFVDIKDWGNAIDICVSEIQEKDPLRRQRLVFGRVIDTVVEAQVSAVEFKEILSESHRIPNSPEFDSHEVMKSILTHKAIELGDIDIAESLVKSIRSGGLYLYLAIVTLEIYPEKFSNMSVFSNMSIQCVIDSGVEKINGASSVISRKAELQEALKGLVKLLKPGFGLEGEDFNVTQKTIADFSSDLIELIELESNEHIRSRDLSALGMIAWNVYSANSDLSRKIFNDINSSIFNVKNTGIQDEMRKMLVGYLCYCGEWMAAVNVLAMIKDEHAARLAAASIVDDWAYKGSDSLGDIPSRLYRATRRHPQLQSNISERMFVAHAKYMAKLGYADHARWAMRQVPYSSRSVWNIGHVSKILASKGRQSQAVDFALEFINEEMLEYEKGVVVQSILDGRAEYQIEKGLIQPAIETIQKIDQDSTRSEYWQNLIKRHPSLYTPEQWADFVTKLSTPLERYRAAMAVSQHVF